MEFLMVRLFASSHLHHSPRQLNNRCCLRFSRWDCCVDFVTHEMAPNDPPKTRRSSQRRRNFHRPTNGNCFSPAFSTSNIDMKVTHNVHKHLTSELWSQVRKREKRKNQEPLWERLSIIAETFTRYERNLMWVYINEWQKNFNRKLREFVEHLTMMKKNIDDMAGSLRRNLILHLQGNDNVWAVKLLPMNSDTKLSNYQKSLSTRRQTFHPQLAAA